MAKVFLGVTLGASLLNNAAKRGLVPQGLDRLRPDDPRQAELEGMDTSPLVDYAAGNPEECCAELNTLAKAARRWDALFSDDVRISLYASDTGQGRLVAKVLEKAACKVLRARTCSASVREIKGLGREAEFQEALLGLAAAIKEDFSKARGEGRLAYLIASGGFKPESTFAVIAAYIAGANGIFYVHETFQKLVEFPMLPLQVKEVVARYSRGEADEHMLVAELGLDVHHLEEVGLLAAPDRRLNPLIAALI
jgi:putative CRISPR-associated protein (TIGR02619 family)